jgi:hypothetical protein
MRPPPEQDSIPKIGTINFRITADYGLEEPDDRLVTNNRKRINSSEVEDREIVEDGLVQTLILFQILVNRNLNKAQVLGREGCLIFID